VIGLAFTAGIALWFLLGYLMGVYVTQQAWPLALGALGMAGVTFLWALRRI
jgi:hypothetical protein